MSKFKDVIIGLLLVIIGVIIGLNAFEITNIEIFFDGWWTLFIIIPCFIGVFESDDKIGNLIGLLIGLLLLLCCQDLFSFDLLWKLLLPIIFIVIGLSILFKNSFNKKISKEINKLNKNEKDSTCYAVFSGQKISLDKKEYKGSNLSAIFGGLEYDLRQAIIKDDIVINCSCVFGGIDILVPDDVKVVISSTSIFGGAENKTSNSDKEKKPIIYINATCIFGGLEVK